MLVIQEQTWNMTNTILSMNTNAKPSPTKQPFTQPKWFLIPVQVLMNDLHTGFYQLGFQNPLKLETIYCWLMSGCQNIFSASSILPSKFVPKSVYNVNH